MAYFRTPFANSGDKAAIPNDAQVDNTVSFEQGYTPQYGLDVNTEPTARRIERNKHNQLMNLITTALQQYQQFSIPDFITSADNGGSAFSYALGSVVRYDPGGGVRIYQSTSNANTALPTVLANWVDITEFGFDFSLGNSSIAGQLNVNDGDISNLKRLGISKNTQSTPLTSNNLVVDSDIVVLTLTQDQAIDDFTNRLSGQDSVFILVIQQDGTGGFDVTGWPTNLIWPGTQLAPVMPQGANESLTLLVVDDGTNFFANPLGVISEVDDWHAVGGAGEPAFQNGWGNLAGFQPMEFKLTPFNEVKMRGFIQAGTTTNGTTLWTMPVGYRPINTIRLPTLPGTVSGYPQILSTGIVQIAGGSAAASISFGEMTFSLD